ncbi:Demethylrebeccamycin-D-glucose O-methyltransferase [Rubripirellula lacrimiformis]|uniref:Demethylrebeccamycin-D-glucose O-methyltransferase n=1 Tax=Rubripirellula lacrimiformis TaxID=1930273 RepID=A0A517NGL1_9BACT|nr:class I SAM-dependent methyltransferase [Rubripirellula lacrimiformis]QDT06276.1 Demethylrebeccamycin-D-glucose O-methyltransferase [Rubripirellula lacrimiformis]
MLDLCDAVSYHFLRRCFPGKRQVSNSRGAHLTGYPERLKNIIGDRRWQSLKSQMVVDFGCGHGDGAIHLASEGFTNVAGIDIRECVLDDARQRAVEAGFADRCHFATSLPETRADVVISMDAFEHFADPAGVLQSMSNLLDPGGQVIVSFGPTWYHPRGGHLFAPFPWAHLVFSESALCQWRRDFRDDGAMRFAEVDGGLNQMTIARFERIVEDSPFKVEWMIARPIDAVRWLHHRWTREFLTSIVDCVLVKR